MSDTSDESLFGTTPPKAISLTHTSTTMGAKPIGKQVKTDMMNSFMRN